MADVRAPFHDGTPQFKARENILNKTNSCQKANYFSKMENENVRQSWEWETDFKHSFWLDIGEKDGVQSLE